MLKRWLVKASETPPTSPILPDPRTAEAPEKAENIVYANAEVVKSMTPKRKRGDYNYYDSADRAKMARYAVDHGVARAARHFTGKLGKNVNESTIRSLKKTYLKIVKSSDDSDSASNSEISEMVKKQRGPPTLIGKYEEEVKDYIESLRASGGVVNRPIVISAARGIIVNKQKSLLSEFGGPVDLSKTWAQSFLRRLGYVRRKGTKAARKVPEDFDMMKMEFLSEILKSVKQYNIPDDLIINFDQTNVMIIPVGDYTLDKVGSKQVSLLGLEDKRQITVLLACTLSGKLLPPQIIYQGKTEMCHPKYKFPDGWNITHSENHWSNGTTMLEYAENILKPYVESVTEELPLSYGNAKALCIFDVFAAHRTDSFLQKLDDMNIKVRFVPASCTGELQPLDLSGNDEFKSSVKNSFIKWYSDKVSQAMNGGKTVKDINIDLKLTSIKPIHASWIVSAFQSVKSDTLIRGWAKTGIKECIDNCRD